ncbi:hypothetical protein D3C72_1872790 [compost metagenome]
MVLMGARAPCSEISRGRLPSMGMNRPCWSRRGVLLAGISKSALPASNIASRRARGTAVKIKLQPSLAPMLRSKSG